MLLCYAALLFIDVCTRLSRSIVFWFYGLCYLLYSHETTADCSQQLVGNKCLNVQHKHMLKSFRATSQDLDTAASAGKTAKVSTFLPTSRRIVQFANGTPAPPGAQVVYIDGGFDLFHLGHLEVLKAAAKLGDYLLVGVHNDDDVTARRGEHLPIMTVHERCLSVMACKHVDEVIIGAHLHATAALHQS